MIIKAPKPTMRRDRARGELIGKLAHLGDFRDVQAAESVIECTKFTAVSTVFSRPQAAVLARSILMTSTRG